MTYFYFYFLFQILSQFILSLSATRSDRKVLYNSRNSKITNITLTNAEEIKLDYHQHFVKYKRHRNNDTGEPKKTTVQGKRRVRWNLENCKQKIRKNVNLKKTKPFKISKAAAAKLFGKKSTSNA